MIPIFDLDDTLYDELTYVQSGFRAVAEWGANHLGLERKASYSRLNHILETKGRGRIFNQWLDGRGSVRDAVRIYRHHTPAISIWDSARRALDALSAHRIYLVTDGHKIVQAKKVAALGIDSQIEHTYITHRYGVVHAKPSTYCFQLIKERERCDWGEMVYIGDNPTKDFVNLNPLGVHTVRVFTGQHRSVIARPGFDAKYPIRSLDDLPDLLTTLRT